MIVADVLGEAATRLRSEGIETARLDAEVLLRHVLGVDRTGLFLRMLDVVGPDDLMAFDALIQRRLALEPVAYLTGVREFMGLNIAVGPGVLVPRPETELLVEWAIRWLSERPPATVVDVGTGSGAIAVSLAASLPSDWRGRIVAVDVSSAALAYAARNRAAHLPTGRWHLIRGSLLAWCGGPIDLILANLPYLRPDQITQRSDLRAEPALALDGGSDGLDLIAALLRDAPRVLAPGGAIGLEIDPSQATHVERLVHAVFPAAAVRIAHDLAGLARIVLVESAARSPTQIRRYDGGRNSNAEEERPRVTIPGKDPRLVPYGETNLGMPLELIDSLVVPNELFFVRSNGPTPALDPATWRLRVDGQVEQSLELSLAELQRLPRRSLTAFLECAGNGRSRYSPPAEGTTWKNDAAGNAVWTGTPLRNVLELARAAPDAIDVVTQGTDMPGMQRGLPVPVALDPATMLVWSMNDEPLPVTHGGPVRLLVPGWAGIASTKWLVGITVSTTPFAGFWNTENYTLQTATGERVAPVREMPVKSIISHPVTGSTVAAGPQTIAGFAWSGHGGIVRVEISVDGGTTWHDSRIVEEAGRHSWVRFAHAWEATHGEAHLRSRATDARGLTQPLQAAWNAKGYLNNGIYEVVVTVGTE